MTLKTVGVRVAKGCECVPGGTLTRKSRKIDAAGGRRYCEEDSDRGELTDVREPFGEPGDVAVREGEFYGELGEDVVVQCIAQGRDVGLGRVVLKDELVVVVMEKTMNVGHE